MSAERDPGQPQRQRSSLIAALVLALLAVAALPFLLAGYQIYLARESLVDQAQQTHLIAARASADRVAALLATVAHAAEGAAGNPQLYEVPNAAAAGEVLAGMLTSRADVLVAATFYRDEAGDHRVTLAQRPEAAGIDEALLAALEPRPRLFEVGGRRLLGLARDTERPGLRLAVVAAADAFDDTLEPRELGESATLLLLDGDRPHPLFASDAKLPEALLEGLRTPGLDAIATRSRGAHGLEVAAFARVPGTPWAIASLQPAAEAEAAAATMRRGALVAVAAVLVLVALLSVLAWRAVVQPVRALLDWQAGQLATGIGGGDLASLRNAFQQIQRHQRNREALSEVFLGRYKLLSTLGQGSMGSVFLAWDPRLKRHVAIKTIHLETLDPRQQAGLARMLENEAVAVANLRHPNIVGVFDLVAAGKFAFVVMEYIEGANLRQVIGHDGALSAPEIVLIAKSMLKALDAAHRVGLLHLDIKPGNVLVPQDGELELTDFGVAAWRHDIADLVARGGLVGTPGFIAPEYVKGEVPTERADLYSLGILLVECLTGKMQNLGGARTNDLRRAAQHAVVLPEALTREQPALTAAVLKLCELDPERRPADASKALALFEALPSAGGLRRLNARVRALAGASQAEAEPTGVRGRAQYNGTTQPPPRADTMPVHPVAETTRPPPAGADTAPPPSAAPTTRPPP